jgi:hypothetical protein
LPKLRSAGEKNVDRKLASDRGIIAAPGDIDAVQPPLSPWRVDDGMPNGLDELATFAVGGVRAAYTMSPTDDEPERPRVERIDDAARPFSWP